MDENEVAEVMEEHGIEKNNMEAAVELGRLVAEETGLCCEELGKFMWMTYKQLQEEGGESA